VRSTAYSILGAIAYRQENYPAAQEYLQKSIDAYPADPDPVVVLRLALAIDKRATAAVDRDQQQKLYADALKVARRAVEMTRENMAIGTPARHERDRLQKLTEGAAPTQPQSPPKN
jgi:tetratricopeptide (TPR) repeat protein